jgi:hypothetical protein
LHPRDVVGGEFIIGQRAAGIKARGADEKVVVDHPVVAVRMVGSGDFLVPDVKRVGVNDEPRLTMSIGSAAGAGSAGAGRTPCCSRLAARSVMAASPGSLRFVKPALGTWHHRQSQDWPSFWPGETWLTIESIALTLAFLQQ